VGAGEFSLEIEGDKTEKAGEGFIYVRVMGKEGSGCELIEESGLCLYFAVGILWITHDFLYWSRQVRRKGVIHMRKAGGPETVFNKGVWFAILFLCVLSFATSPSRGIVEVTFIFIYHIPLLL